MTCVNTSASLESPDLLRLRAYQADREVLSGHLRLGGQNSEGHTLSFTSYYMEQDGRPCLPILGEFHFSRFPRRFWQHELAKIAALGVDMVASYVFWNHVEEDEGSFDWSEDRDLRSFVQLCASQGLQVLVRLGPFCHGECRNGGLPDWLYGRPFAVRSTDPRFMRYVRRLYGEIGAQLKGQLFKDGGPVVGVQLDNEYMHAGAPWEVTVRQGIEWVPSGTEGTAYMRALKDLALESGLDVPLYTCTAWLGSPVLEDELLPMQGGYAYTPWVLDPEYRQPPTREFLFRDRHAQPLPQGEPSYEPTRYPYACCELGSGSQITYNHRYVVQAECVESMAVVALGSGANLIGYYMIHGGSNPVGRHSYLNENTVPRISYDFQAPIREFGQLGDSYGSLKLVNRFVQTFGHLLAPMAVALPAASSEIVPEDTTTVRWAARLSDGSGFVFMTNYQDHIERQDQRDIRLSLELGTETLTLPRESGLVLRKNASAILPVNLKLRGILLAYATAQPLLALGSQVYVFFAPPGMLPTEYAFATATYADLSVAGGQILEADDRAYVAVEPGTAAMITLRSKAGETVRILTLTHDQALHCWTCKLEGAERIVLSDALVLAEQGRLRLSSMAQETIHLSIYPALPGGLRTVHGQADEVKDGHFAHYCIQVPARDVPLQVTRIAPDWCAVRIPADVLSQLKDIFLRVDYAGDIAEAFINGRLVADNFYNGTPWEIGLKRFAEQLVTHELVLHVTPLKRDGHLLRYVPSGMAMRVESTGHGLASIDALSAAPEYEVIAWPKGR